MDLKHLKMKSEALKACDIALSDYFVKHEKRNIILKLRFKLFADLNKRTAKITTKLNKQKKKKSTKPQVPAPVVAAPPRLTRM